MALLLFPGLRAPNGLALAVAKRIHIAARRQLKRSSQNIAVVHLHQAPFVFGLEPFRQDEIAYSDSIDLVNAGLDRIADLIRHACRSAAASLVAVEALSVKVRIRIGHHFENLVRKSRGELAV